MGIVCPSAHKKMETLARHEAQTGHHGRSPREVTNDKMEPRGTTLEERRTTEKAKAVGLCFGREALGRLGGRWAEGQQHQLQHELCVCFACEHCGCGDAEICAHFHDVSVTIQHALEKTQDHANDERSTRKVVFDEPLRSPFVSQWTSKMKC